MRRARLKPNGIPMFYHLYNRVAGEPEFYPFGATEKEKFIRLLHRVQKFFVVEVLAYQVMSNHFHLLVYAPEEAPSPAEVVRRYEDYHDGKRTISIDDPLCVELGQRMRDISWFMHALQQQFATWYNHSRSSQRRGALWAQRFKHTLLGEAEAVWACWKYIEMNPVRAGLVKDPGDYRFSSYGAWRGKGSHPFADNLQHHMLPILQGLYPYSTLQEVYSSLQHALVKPRDRMTAHGDDLSESLDMLDHRTKYWVDGLVIGTTIFVRDIIARSNGVLEHRDGWSPTRAPDEFGTPSMMIYNAPRHT